MKEFIIKLKQRIHGKYFSNFESIFTGSGLEVDDFRVYNPGDNPKSINWKLTAKMDQIFINVFQEEKSVDLDIFLDINYNRKGKTKSGYNAEIALNILGDILVYAKKHLISLNLFTSPIFQPGNDINIIKQTIISQDMGQAYDFLHKFPKQLNTIKKNYYSFNKAFLIKAKNNRRKRAIVIISDFLEIDDNDLRLIKQLNKDHSVYLFRLPVDNNFGQNYEHNILFKTDIGIRFFEL